MSERLYLTLMRERGSTDILPYVAAIIRHYVRVFAALYYDNFLLDDRKVILCGSRQRDTFIIIITLHVSTGVVSGHTGYMLTAYL